MNVAADACEFMRFTDSRVELGLSGLACDLNCVFAQCMQLGLSDRGLPSNFEMPNAFGVLKFLQVYVIFRVQNIAWDVNY